MQFLEPVGRGFDYQMGGKLELSFAGLLGIFRNFYKTDCRTVKAGISSMHREGAEFRERAKKRQAGQTVRKGNSGTQLATVTFTIGAALSW